VSQSLFHASLAASTACAACARVCVAPPILCCLLFIIVISCMEIERSMVVYTLFLSCWSEREPPAVLFTVVVWQLQAVVKP
jgi:hypothetical protein